MSRRRVDRCVESVAGDIDASRAGSWITVSMLSLGCELRTQTPLIKLRGNTA